MSEDLIYPRHSAAERIALAFVLLALVGIPLLALGYQFLLRPALAPVRVIELVGRLPTSEQGGWTPETITVQKGEHVRLRLTSADVVHGFTIPKLGIETDKWLEPGKVQEIDFVAEQAGRYEFLCTVWCEAGHWRMRGAIEVIDPNDPIASARDISPPATDWVATGIDIDAEHPGEFVPFVPPSAAHGETIWTEFSDESILDHFPDADLRLLSPSDAFARLSQPASPATSLSDVERWDVVAHLWAQQSTLQMRELGERLYERDCTGCHGLSGQGDGPGAAAIEHTEHEYDDMSRPVTDFTDLTAQAGASDMLYYGKLVRGGMGTSMPYWGTIYTEDELWALIAYLRGLGFDFGQPDE
ncbi:MAG: c-type cytochrome [Caldilineales bacterium]|nr:c-type cytochrome [Caldilineales bacterium]